MADPSGRTRGPRLALEFGADAIRLKRRDGDVWSLVDMAPLDAPDLAAAGSRIAQTAARLSGGAPPQAELWLPPEQVLALTAPMKPGATREDAAASALAGSSPVSHQHLLIDVAPTGGGLAIAAAERLVVEEALDYARRWGFEPVRVTAPPGAKAALLAFPDGPDFYKAPAPEPALPPGPAARAPMRGRVRAVVIGAAVAAAGLGVVLLLPGSEAPEPKRLAAPAPLSAPSVGPGSPAPLIEDAPAPGLRAVFRAALPPPGAGFEPDRSSAPAAKAPSPILSPEPAKAAEGPAPPPYPASSDRSLPIGAPVAPAEPPQAVAARPPGEPPAEELVAEEIVPEEAGAEEADAPGPGALARSPAPRPRPDELDMRPSENIAARAPAPAPRPRSIRPAAPVATETAARAPTEGALDDDEGDEAGFGETEARRGPPTGLGVAAAATLRDALRLDDMSLIGVFGAEGSRRALIRMADGAIHRVSAGAVIEGWVVSAIEATSMRVTRAGEARTLELVR